MSIQLSVFTRYAIRSLAANRTRTVVTAAGVALACALLTFVLVLVGSLRASLVASEGASEGAWQVSFSQIGEDQLARVEDVLGGPLAVRRDLGAALTGDAEAPLLNVVTTLTGEKDLVVEPPLADGRWPEAPGEIAVPSHRAKTWPVGSTVELSLGRRQRTSGGISAYEYPPSYELDEKGVAQLAEELVDVGEPRALTVVGIVDGDSDVAYVCPDEPGFGPEPLIFAWAAPDLGVDELDQMTEGICEHGGYSSYHNALLEYLSLGNSRGFDMSVGFIGACASALACLVTVTLISGAFRVSVAERVRQFGLLSSAGASRRQLVRVVLAEAALLSAMGIPAGLALGVALDAAALSLAADGTAWVTGGLPIALSVEPAALLIAACVSVAAVLMGALAPALRASRLPAVEAMRDGEFVGSRWRREGPPRVLQARSVRRSCPSAGPSRLHREPEGHDLPILLARRFRRSGRERGRATVAALALSVALLVGGGIMATYQGEAIFEGTPADVSAKVSSEGAAAALGAKSELVYLPALLERLRAQDGINEAGFVSKTQVSLDLDDSAVAEWADEELWRPDGNVFGTVLYVDDATWARLCEEVGAAADPGGCIVVNEVTDADRAGERPFSEALLGTRLSVVGAGVSWEVVGLLDGVPGWFWLTRGELESVLPTVLASASTVADVDRDLVGYGFVTLYATAEDSVRAAEDVERLLEEDPALAALDGAVDERAEAHQARVLYAALEVLLSGVGIVAAAVGLASAFNASAASVLLRSHDFAVLRSVGWGERALRRMLAYECARTAACGLALGLAVALAFDVWLYVRGGISVRSLGLVVPWAHVAGAVVLVALVLLASCVYAMHRLRDVPLLDALRAD